MQRHMQNISFLVIVGVLLSCAFFFSEQVSVGEEPQNATDTAIPLIETRENLPDCSAAPDDDAALACFQESVEISQRLVDHISEQILSQETDPARRLDFVDLQQAWETSRDADCHFVLDQAASEEVGEIGREKCLMERNLSRLDQLESYFCTAAGGASCDASVQSLP